MPSTTAVAVLDYETLASLWGLTDVCGPNSPLVTTGQKLQALHVLVITFGAWNCLSEQRMFATNPGRDKRTHAHTL